MHRRQRHGARRHQRPAPGPTAGDVDELQPYGNQAVQDQLQEQSVEEQSVKEESVEEESVKEESVEEEVEEEGPQAEIHDQYRLNHEWNDGFCGIATLLTTLSGLGVDHGVDPSNRADLAAFSRGIYTRGDGSSGAKMAEKLVEMGQKEARFTLGGTVSDVVKMVVAGKPVPVGVLSVAGQVVKSPEESARYKGAIQEGGRHSHRFGASGHWLTVVGFEGPENSPTSLLVNDSDTGAQLRMTLAELSTASDAKNGIWMIGY
ncbi:MAG: hypothetical protein GY913_14675 [Proteobacteria bacterium]|nr:hypothetical protein [Pseudomonadota bacterium]MCP4918155.1 hypothetical protein [Pseudomonadota bacterium]